MKGKVVAIIPARGGSKGVPRKNIRDLCGKPLIWYTIQVALSSELIDNVIVSTEDTEVADISRKCGAEVPFLRPGKLAEDKSNLSEAVWWSVSKLLELGYKPDIFVVMLPVTPFRTSQMIDGIVGLTQTNAAIGASASNTELQPSDFFMLKNGRMVALDTQRANTPCQLVHEFTSVCAVNMAPVGKNYLENPVGWADYVAQMRQRGVPRFQNTRRFYLVNDPILELDINTEEDFELAELVLKKGLFKPEFN